MTGITNPTEECFKDGMWGWDGTQWRKLGLLLGYSDTVSERKLNLAADAGYNVLLGTTVPAGYIYVITAASARNSTTDIARIEITARVGGINTVLIQEDPSAAGVAVCWGGQIVLGEGDCLLANIGSCVAGDALYFQYTGYKMAVT